MVKKLGHFIRAERWSLGIVFTPLVLVMNYITFVDQYFERVDAVIWTFLISGFLGFTTCFVLFNIDLRLRVYYPSQALMRIIVGFVIHSTISTLAITISFLGYDVLNLFDYKANIAHFKWADLA